MEFIAADVKSCPVPHLSWLERKGFLGGNGWRGVGSLVQILIKSNVPALLLLLLMPGVCPAPINGNVRKKEEKGVFDKLKEDSV